MELRDYQVAHLAFFIKKKRCLDLSDPGVGKTPPACVYMYFHWTERQGRVVWTMPKSLLKKNADELLLWSDFEPEDIVIVDGPKAKREKLMKTDAKVFLMGFDCFSRNWRDFLKIKPDISLHVSDEIHLGYGGPNSQRTNEMLEAMRKIPYFLGMTGTVINGRLSSVYPCIALCEPRMYPNYDAFEMMHALKDSYGNTTAWVHTKPISQFLRRHGVRKTFESAYGKEKKIIQIEKCQMERRQRAAYKEFEESALLELEESWLEGTLPGVNLIRCRQLMEHPQTFGPPLDVIKQTGKEERLEVHLEHHVQTRKPLVIFSALVPSQERIVELCGKFQLRIGLINGSVSQKRRVEIDEAFRAGELDVIVASPATAGVGFNWGHVDHIIFTSLDYMDSSFVQGYRRAIRGVRDKALLITVLEYEDSMDRKIFTIVEEKSRLASDVDDTKERLDLKQTGKKRKHMKKPTMGEALQ